MHCLLALPLLLLLLLASISNEKVGGGCTLR
jgi:hypothetical protein